MARTGKPPNKVPTIPWKVYVPMPMAAEVELLLLDPVREKVKYNERNKLVVSLLAKWLEEKRKEEKPNELGQSS